MSQLIDRLAAQGLLSRPSVSVRPSHRLRREWEGQAAVIIGGGPSAGDIDPALLAGNRLIAVNRAHERYPQADILYFGDESYWDSDQAKIRAFPGRIVTTATRAARALGALRAQRMRRGDRGQLETRNTHVIDANSGLAALNLAINLGADPVYLTGFDMRLVNGRKHFHDGYPAHLLPGGPVPKSCEAMLAEWEGIAEQCRNLGVRVINATPGSALEGFEALPDGMQLVGGVWLPRSERHFAQWMTNAHRRIDGRLTYQYGKFEACLPWIGRRRLALSVGSNVGLWSMHLAKHFAAVQCFEPMAEFRACWKKNMNGHGNAILQPYALGAYCGTVHMRRGPADDCGCTCVAEEGIEVHLRTVDLFGFEDVDFIKIDVEGYEFHVLEGAIETLRRCRPCLIVEQKPETGMREKYGLEPRQVIELLTGLGAKQRAVLSGDYIFSFDEPGHA